MVVHESQHLGGDGMSYVVNLSQPGLQETLSPKKVKMEKKQLWHGQRPGWWLRGLFTIILLRAEAPSIPLAPWSLQHFRVLLNPQAKIKWTSISNRKHQKEEIELGFLSHTQYPQALPRLNSVCDFMLEETVNLIESRVTY